MDWLSIAFSALLTATLPVTVISFLLVWWALRRGLLEELDGVKALNKEIEAFGKAQKGKGKTKVNPIHDKWLKLGGGYYGTVGLYTMILIEWSEVVDLLTGLGDLVFRLDISVLINFFIESFKNFITAISWPVYWIGKVGGNNIWIWMLMAYLGYSLGMRLAQYYTGQPGARIWSKIESLSQGIEGLEGRLAGKIKKETDEDKGREE